MTTKRTLRTQYQFEYDENTVPAHLRDREDLANQRLSITREDDGLWWFCNFEMPRGTLFGDDYDAMRVGWHPRMGTIANRHDMPVDFYLIEQRRLTTGQFAYDLAYQKVLERQWHPTVTVMVYYTGLNDVTLAVQDAFERLKQPYAFMRYHVKSGDYEPVHRQVCEGSCYLNV